MSGSQLGCYPMTTYSHRNIDGHYDNLLLELSLVYIATGLKEGENIYKHTHIYIVLVSGRIGRARENQRSYDCARRRRQNFGEPLASLFVRSIIGPVK